MGIKNTALEEVFIVGSRYGELADEVSKLFNLNRPIEKKDITQAIGDDVVYLKPVYNDLDQYCVAVFNQDTQRIGYVWMYQAPTMRSWLDFHDEEYIKARVSDAIPMANVLLAELEETLDVPMTFRRCNDVDPSWANDLPGVLRGDSDEGLDLQLTVLRNELEKAKEWNKSLEKKINNLLKAIPLDLSAYRHNVYMEVFVMMRKSEIKEVRQQSDYLLSNLLFRGSKEHVRWWTEEWFPTYFRKASVERMLRLFEAAHYTLERVEELLEKAPVGLFHHYLADKLYFVNRLYYYALPRDTYNRLLTLLAIRAAMIEKGESTEASDSSASLSKDILARAIENVQSYFWGYSSNAVIFCVLRDKYDYPDNASLYERESRDLIYRKEIRYICKDGTLANAFSRNPYLKYKIDTWESNGAKKRALILRDEFIKAVEKAKAEK